MSVINRIKTLKNNFSVWDALLMLGWLIAFGVILPLGNFPINDDWAYAKNVYHLAVNHQFLVDTWPAMNLLSQTIYGSLFALCFGFSFVVLRLSIFILVIISSFYFSRIVSMLSLQSKAVSFYCTAALFFNPITLQLAFTFMTDMFFLSMMIFSVYHFIKHVNTHRLNNYVWFVVFLVSAVLTRQQGLLFSVLSLLLLIKEGNLWKRLLLTFIPPLLAWLAHDKYQHYLCVYHIPNGIKSTDDIFEYLGRAKITHHFINAGDSLLIMGLILLPLIVLLIASRKYSLNVKHMLLFGIGSICAMLLISFDWKFYPLGNISMVLETGPRLVKTNSVSGYDHRHILIRSIQLYISVFSIISCIYLITDAKRTMDIERNMLRLLIFVIAAVFFVFVSVSEAYFDRYNIPVVFFIILLLVPEERINLPLTTKVIMPIILLGIFFCSLLEVRDFFNWQEKRWAALKHLNNRGISPSQIDGGFEYNGWYKPIESWSEKDKSWWWVKDDEYVVNSKRLNNYAVEKIYTYQHVMPYYTDTIFVLKRNSP